MQIIEAKIMANTVVCLNFGHGNPRYSQRKLILVLFPYSKTSMISRVPSSLSILAEAHNVSYPRVDPVTMALVVSPDNNEILLGRQPSFPRGFFTCLAGFAEPGESLETTVKREVYEECGIRVTDVRYQFSQYWPYPSSLMLGCVATASDTTVRLDAHELEEACWVTREEAANMLSSQTAREHSKGKEVRIAPPKQTLAHQLIKGWIDEQC